MDTSTYLIELLGSFDGDMSALSEESSNMSGASGSPDRSSGSIDDSAAGDSSLFQSPPLRHPRRTPAMSPPLMSPISAPAAALSSAAPSGAGAAAPAAAAAASDIRPGSDHPPRAVSRPDHDDLSLRYSQLKKSYRKQAEELEKTTRELDHEKRTSSRERMELEERVRAVEHKHALLESQYQKAQLEFNHALATKTSELNGVSSALRSAQAQLSDANPDILKQIEYVKDDLSDLAISESLYLEYKSIDPHRQTIREYVCCAVFELVRAERGAREAVVKEMELVRIKCINAEDEADRNARERDQLARLKKSRETELQSELTHLETLNSKLHDDLTTKTLLVQSLSSKGDLYDELQRQARRVEEELAQVKQRDLIQSLTLKSLSEERESLQSRVASLDQSQDLLRMDKMYLTKEVERLGETLGATRTTLERSEREGGELRRQKEELVEKLVKVREEHQQSYEEKLNAELNRLQTRTTADLESIRQTQREAFEREIAGLKESRDRAAQECERQRTAADALREDLTALQEEHRRLQSTLETERSDARNALKIQRFDSDRLSLTLEENLAALRSLKIEHEVLQKKAALLRDELFALQGSSRERGQDLENQVRNLSEKLQMYQQLEYELDMAILGAGGLQQQEEEKKEGGGTGGSGGGVRGIHHLLESLGSNVPTANKRRMKQSILLAQQLVEKQKNLDMVSKELAHFKQRNEELDAELDAAKRALACTSQPHSYLIQALQAKESELASVQSQLSQTQKRLREREEELARAVTARAHMEADLHRLLHGKAQVDQIKEALLANQHKYASNTSRLDQQFAAQQGGGGGGARGASPSFTSTLQPQQQQPQHSHQYAAHSMAGLPSFNDPRNHHPHNSQGMGRPHYPNDSPPSLTGFQAIAAQAQAHAHSAYPAHAPYAMPNSNLSSSQGRSTSSIPAHNTPMTQSRGAGPPQSGDAGLDAQPKPLWFRKLAQQ